MAKIRVKALETGARLRVRGLTPPGPAAMLAYSNRNGSDRNTWYDLFSDEATTMYINASVYQSVTKLMLCYRNTATGEITDLTSSTEYLSLRINGTKLQFTTGSAAINLPTGCKFVVKYTAEEKPVYFTTDTYFTDKGSSETQNTNVSSTYTYLLDSSGNAIHVVPSWTIVIKGIYDVSGNEVDSSGCSISLNSVNQIKLYKTYSGGREMYKVKIAIYQ